VCAQLVGREATAATIGEHHVAAIFISSSSLLSLLLFC
jgi:hypothetical protein